jgi:hypothetical protein
VAWIDLVAPRTTPLTKLVRPAYPADVAAAAGVPFGVASIVGPFSGSDSSMGGDLILVDLTSASSRQLVARETDSESLDLPAIWPDGRGILYQRSNLHAQIPLPGQAQPQYQSNVEQVGPDGRNPTPLLNNARYPGPAPDGSHFVFVRSTDAASGIYVHSVDDGADADLIPPGQFLALAYPRFSPDGRRSGGVRCDQPGVTNRRACGAVRVAPATDGAGARFPMGSVDRQRGRIELAPDRERHRRRSIYRLVARRKPVVDLWWLGQLRGGCRQRGRPIADVPGRLRFGGLVAGLTPQRFWLTMR